MATQPVNNYFRKAYQDFLGGLCSRPNALTVPANKFVQLDNAVLAEHDILEKAPGYILDGSPFPNNPDSFIRFIINYKVGQSVNSIVCAAADAGNTNDTYTVDLKQSFGDGNYDYFGYTDGTATFTNGSSSVVGLSTLWNSHLKAGDKIKPDGTDVWYEIDSVDSDTTLTLIDTFAETTQTSVTYKGRFILNTNNVPVGMIFNNKLLITNGSETPFTFDNSTVHNLLSADVPKAQYCTPHKSRVFMANTSGNPSTLYWSAPNDETVWDPVSVAPIFPNDNGSIVRILSFANSLIVFKDNGVIYQLIGEFDQDAQGQPALIRRLDVPDNLGVIAGRSVVINDDNKIYFLCETGIYTIDTRMYIEKVSWDITPDISNLLFKSTLAATKQYAFNNTNAWRDGFNGSGIFTNRVLNSISPQFDLYQITDCLQGHGKAAMDVDRQGSEDVYVAYINSAGTGVNFLHWLDEDNSHTTTSVPMSSTVATYGNPVCVGIAASIGRVGIVTKHAYGPNTGLLAGGLAYYFFHELVSGTWTTTQIYATNPTDGSVQGFGVRDMSYQAGAIGISVYYETSGEPRVLVTNGAGALFSGGVTFYSGQSAVFLKRTAGVWSTVNSDIRNGSQVLLSDCALTQDSSGNLYIALVQQVSAKVDILKSTNLGISWSAYGDGGITSDGYTALGSGKISLYLNNLEQPVLVYNFQEGAGGSTGKIKKVVFLPGGGVVGPDDYGTKVLKGAISLQMGLLGISPGGGEVFYSSNDNNAEQYDFSKIYTEGTAQFTNGSVNIVGTGTAWLDNVVATDLIKLSSDSDADYAVVQSVNSNTSITLTGNYAGSSDTNDYIIKDPLATANETVGTLSNTHRTNSNCIINDGTAIVYTIAYGSSANELVVRRINLYINMESDVLSDSTLSQWGTFITDGVVTGGNRIDFEVGLDTTSSIDPEDFNSITSGEVISTNASKIYVQARIKYLFLNFAQASVQSLIMNYVGTGIDAKLPCAFVFNNEMYLAITQLGEENNNNIVVLDRNHAWNSTNIPVFCFTRYNQIMYGGSSLNGDVYRLRQGYNFNGEDYSLTAITKEDLLGSLELKKDVSKIYVIYQTQTRGTFTFSYRLDNYTNPGIVPWNDTIIDQTVNGIAEIDVGQTAASIQFKIAQDDSDVRVGVVGFIVLYGYLNVR